MRERSEKSEHFYLYGIHLLTLIMSHLSKFVNNKSVLYKRVFSKKF